mgnify:CR=1 FL=1
MRHNWTGYDMTRQDMTRPENHTLPEDAVEEKRIRPKSVERQMIENRLRETVIDELVTYEELEKLIGESCAPGSKYREYAQQAARSLLNERLIFDAEETNKEGIRRIDGDAASRKARRKINEVHKKAITTIKIGGSIDLTQCSLVGKNTALAAMRAAASVRKMTTPKFITELSSHPESPAEHQRALMERMGANAKRNRNQCET